MQQLNIKQLLAVTLCGSFLMFGCSMAELEKVSINKINADLNKVPSAAGFVATSASVDNQLYTGSGNNYYVCDTGDDNNSGTSTSDPFKTFDKAMQVFTSMSAGGSVLFCRGGVFQTSTNRRLSNFRCSKNAACSLSDYGSASASRPIIVANGVDALNFEEGGNADQDGGYYISNLILKTSSASGVGIRFYNDVDDVVMENLHIEGFKLAVYSAGANSPNSGSNRINENVTLNNSVIFSNGTSGWLGGCSNCKITNNRFENNGFNRAIFDHNLYFYNPWKTSPATNVLISGNTLYRSTMVNGKCEGVSLVVHGQEHHQQPDRDPGASRQARCRQADPHQGVEC